MLRSQRSDLFLYGGFLSLFGLQMSEWVATKYFVGTFYLSFLAPIEHDHEDVESRLVATYSYHLF